MLRVYWALAVLSIMGLVTDRVSAQPGTVIVQLTMPPAAVKLPASARKSGAAASAHRVARLGVASAAAAAEQASFHSAAAAAGLQLRFNLLHTYRYVRYCLPSHRSMNTCYAVTVGDDLAELACCVGHTKAWA